MLENSLAETQKNCNPFRGDPSIVSNKHRDDIGVLGEKTLASLT